MTEPATSTTRFCPACGAAATGRFCSTCGAPLAGARRATWIPYALGGAAIVAIFFVVGVKGRSQSLSANGAGAPMAAFTAPAPDISNLTPRERAARLYDRIMRLHEERKADSVAFFAPMALGSYAAIPDMDNDSRYDMGRVAMVAGEFPVARAQADTILRANPAHLLGLLLRADIARADKDPATASKLEATFVAAAPRERARKLPEYEAHKSEIESALSRLSRK